MRGGREQGCFRIVYMTGFDVSSVEHSSATTSEVIKTLIVYKIKCGHKARTQFLLRAGHP